MKQINILIITYKQEREIRRNLDSILKQKDFGLNQVIICDDCSPDSTWDVVCEYKNRFPDIIVPYQNDHNLGIYGNYNELIKKRGIADFYYVLAGDDELCDGIFEKLQYLAELNDIRNTDQTAVYFDWMAKKVDGRCVQYKNNLVARHNHNIFGLKLRNLISNRSCFVTKGIMDKMEPVDLSLGLSLAESLADLQYSILAQNNFYYSYIGSIYYSGIGVSTTIFTDEYLESSIKAWDVIKSKFDLSKKDSAWIEYEKNFYRFWINPSVSRLFLTIKSYFSGCYFVSVKQTLIDLYTIVSKIK